MKKNIGEFSWLKLFLSCVLCSAPGGLVYRHFSFQQTPSANDVSSKLLEMQQRELDELNRRLDKLEAPKAAAPPSGDRSKDSKN